MMETKMNEIMQLEQHQQMKSIDSIDNCKENHNLDSERMYNNDKHQNQNDQNNNNTNNNGDNKWFILEGIKNDQILENVDRKPPLLTGYVLKRRKRPLKGWHKRYFHLENGILSYAKNSSNWKKHKWHGSTDIGLSFISYKPSSRRIDIDSDSGIYHLKTKKDDYYRWIDALRVHRIARQYEIASNMNLNNNNNVEINDKCDKFNNNQSQNKQTNTNNLQSISLMLEKSNINLNEIQEKLIKLGSLLKSIETSSPSPTPTTVTAMSMMTTSSSSSTTNNSNDTYNKYMKKTSSKLKKFHLHRLKNKSSNKSSKDNTAVKTLLKQQSFLSISHPSLTDDNLGENINNNNLNLNLNINTKHDSMKDFVQLANEINNNFRSFLKLMQELKSIEEQQQQQTIDDNNNENNQKLRSLRVSFDNNNNNNNIINDDYNNVFVVDGDDDNDDVFAKNDKYSQHFNRTLSIDETSTISVSEYHDAEDNVSFNANNNNNRGSDVVYNLTTSSSSSDEEDEVDDLDEEDDESIITNYTVDNKQINQIAKLDQIQTIKLRTRLPSIQPTNDVSLWSLLRKNIGKDLSKISMPVTINEPLNLLQRLCEELEYCELLDMASAMIDDPCQRMLMIAAFAISSYSSSYYRCGHKPFNPLLGETYECIRDDKGFRFVGEQVCHHPPISACHAQSKNYVLWQDMRVKTKFWGKSMEIIPIGTVNLILRPSNSHYQWNKITTCVHNLFHGERYVDIYGELTITETSESDAHSDQLLTCKITFDKPSYWSNSQNEIHGTVIDGRGQIIERIKGHWNESVYAGSRCIWRAGTMPNDASKYYGFTRFAIELNELLESEKPWLPPTDTRFRPDQRALEEGNIQLAEKLKHELEQKQRERRLANDQNNQHHKPLWFSKQPNQNKNDEFEEIYLFNDQYWDCRQKHFEGVDFVKLW